MKFSMGANFSLQSRYQSIYPENGDFELQPVSWIRIGFNAEHDSDPYPAFRSMWIRIQFRIRIQGFEI